MNCEYGPCAQTTAADLPAVFEPRVLTFKRWNDSNATAAPPGDLRCRRIVIPEHCPITVSPRLPSPAMSWIESRQERAFGSGYFRSSWMSDDRNKPRATFYFSAMVIVLPIMYFLSIGPDRKCRGVLGGTGSTCVCICFPPRHRSNDATVPAPVRRTGAGWTRVAAKSQSLYGGRSRQGRTFPSVSIF